MRWSLRLRVIGGSDTYLPALRACAPVRGVSMLSSRAAADVEANVVGTLCENNDWFAKDRPLPRAEVGDLFVVHDTGAHSHSMGFQYNGKLRAPEILRREDGSLQLIRDRETIASLYENTYQLN